MNNLHRYGRRAIVAALWASIAARTATATDIRWLNAQGGNFNIFTDWQGNTVPGPNDVAHFQVDFNSGYTYTVGFPINVTNEGVYIHNDNVTWNFFGTTYTVTGISGYDSFVLGQNPGEIGSVTIIGGTFNTSDTNQSAPELYYHSSIGETAGGVGTVNLTSGAVWNDFGQFESVGDLGVGFLNQDSGTHALSGFLSLGTDYSGTGHYSLGGSGVLTVNGEDIGDNGVGTFVQTGGINTSSEFVVIGALGTGIFSLSGTGVINANDGEMLAFEGGSGTFFQSGGTNNVSLGLSVGWNTAFPAEPGGTGVYSLSSGNLHVTGNEFIGSGEAGSFFQTGGTNSVTGSFVAGSTSVNNNFNGTPTTFYGAAVYSLSGPGLLSVAGNMYIGSDSGCSGIFVQSAGTATAASVSIGYSSGANGTYSLSQSGYLHASEVDVGSSGNGTFTQTNGTNQIDGFFELAVNAGSVGYYSLGGGSLSVGGASNVGVFVANQGTATFNQSGGTFSFTDSPNTYEFNVGFAANSHGTYNLTSGLLSVANEYIGRSGNGVFNQTGGTNNLHELDLGLNGGGSGTYSLGSGATLTTSSDENIGYGGAGTFIQSGGSNTTGSSYNINIAYAVGTTGSYSLSGTGVVSTGAVCVGGASNTPGGKGTFNMGGGSLNASSVFRVFNSSGTSATISAGTLTTGGAVDILGTLDSIGGTISGSNLYDTGLITQTAGLVTTPGGVLYLGQNSGSTGIYSLSGTGTLTTGNGEEDIGLVGSGTVVQSAGSNTIGSGWSLNLGYNSGASGTYNLSGGSVGFNFATSGVYIGGSSNGAGGQGVFSISGTGSMSVPGNVTIYNTAGSSLSLQTGGSLTANALIVSGVPALFNWTGGSLTLTRALDFTTGTDPSYNGIVFGNSLTLNANQSLTDQTWEYLYGPGSSITQNGGSNTTPALYLGNTSGSGGSATFNLNSGSLTVSSSEFIGYIGTYGGATGNGLFSQIGGTNSVGTLFVGYNPGASGSASYGLAQGSLSVTGSEYVGYSNGQATFTQTGGIHTVGSGGLYIGYSPSATGSFFLGATGFPTGTITVSTPNLYVGGSSTAAGGVGHLTISDGGAMSVTGLTRIWNSSGTSLSITGNGYLDLNKGRMIFDSNTSNFAGDYNTLRNDIIGGEIRSSSSSSTTTLGLLRGSDYLLLHGLAATFGGQAVSSTDVLIKYTYVGDATLDGQITAADYAQIDTGFLLGHYDGISAVAQWINGDFNYDGIVDYRDYALIDHAYLVQSGVLADSLIDEHAAEFGQPYLDVLSALDNPVPEPASLALVGVGGAVLLLRRRAGGRSLRGCV